MDTESKTSEAKTTDDLSGKDESATAFYNISVLMDARRSIVKSLSRQDYQKAYVEKLEMAFADAVKEEAAHLRDKQKSNYDIRYACKLLNTMSENSSAIIEAIKPNKQFGY